MPADGRWDFNLILLTWRIWWTPNNGSRWRIRFKVIIFTFYTAIHISCSDISYVTNTKPFVVQLTHINWFLAASFLPSLTLLYVLYISDKLNSITLSSRLSVTHTVCLLFHFSVIRPGMGGYNFLLYLFVYKWLL